MKKKYLVGLAVIMVLTFIYGITAKTTKQLNNELLIGEHTTITGEQLYQKNCAAYHGTDLVGNPPTFPSLIKIDERMKKNQVVELLQTGRNVMPSFEVLATSDKNDIYAYLGTFEKETTTNSHKNGMGCQMRCRNMN